MKEEWKDIPGYEGLYQASTLGQIRTCEGKTTKSARFEHRVWKQRIMKQKCCSNKHGRKDYRIELWKDGTHKTWLVARLIALTWCNGYSDGFTVNHIDGNPLNNQIDNLEWLSLKDNLIHGFETGLFDTQKQCVLMNCNGEKMQFRSQSQASRFLGRSDSYIANCIRRKQTIKSSAGQVYQISRGNLT